MKAGLAVVAAAAWIAGCGGDDETTTTSATTTTTPTTAKEERTPTDRQPPVGDGTGGVELVEIGSFDQPVYVTQPPDGGDLYVVEQTGRVQRVPIDGGDPELFLDLSDEITCCGEQGLLSIAFAPDYAKSGRLYASFTNSEGDSRVVEYRAEGDGVDEGSARELLALDDPYSNHNGGLLLFDSDGRLLLGMGDGGSGGDPDRTAQDPSSLFGKLIGVDTSGGGDHEVVALGLRNPWRFSFDRETGDLWIGDVGQSEFEEVDAVAPGEVDGANFGWSAFEGNAPFNSDQEAPGHVPPLLTYPTGEGCAVTGGYVVRDPELRSLYGRYLYADYCQGELRSFTAEPGRQAADDTDLGVQVPALSSFGEDAAGHIYVTSTDGPVYRLAPG